MATAGEYSETIERELEAFFTRDMLRDPVTASEFSLADLAHSLSGKLETLVTEHRKAHRHLTALMAEEQPEGTGGDGELAFLLYFLHHPPEELYRQISAEPPLKALWDAMAAAAPPPALTPEEFDRLSDSLPATDTVKCNEWGDIYGTSTYEQLDAGWANTLVNDLKNHLPKWMGEGYGRADFVHRDWKRPLPLHGADDDCIRIAIIGDWGSGKYELHGLQGTDGPAYAVMDRITMLSPQPDYLVHLGDTYYSGTGKHRSPTGEEMQNLVDVLRQYPNIAKPGRCFTLNSNHEMYGGAHGLYDCALKDDLFSAQDGCTYFALEFGDWILVGIDSAYFDPSTLYMDGGLGGGENPQYDFLRRVQSMGKKVILFSHHTGLTTDGRSPSKYLWEDVTGVITPDYWYWGHAHLGAAYSEQAYSKSIKTRCIGHSSMPFAIPPGMAQCYGDTVDWYAHTPLTSSGMPEALYYNSPRATNGFAMLTVTTSGIVEEAYEFASSTPVWRQCVETLCV